MTFFFRYFFLHLPAFTFFFLPLSFWSPTFSLLRTFAWTSHVCSRVSPDLHLQFSVQQASHHHHHHHHHLRHSVDAGDPSRLSALRWTMNMTAGVRRIYQELVMMDLTVILAHQEIKTMTIQPMTMIMFFFFLSFFFSSFYFTTDQPSFFSACINQFLVFFLWAERAYLFRCSLYSVLSFFLLSPACLCADDI